MILFDTGDNVIVDFDWTDVLPSGVTLSSVVHSVTSPLVKGTEGNNTTGSYVRVSGALHAGLYMVEGAATLSNGEIVNRQFPIRGWNS